MANSLTLKSFKSTIIIILPILLLISFQFILINAHGGTDHDEDTHTSSSSNNVHSKKLKLVKIWCLIIFFFSTFSFGISPYFLRWNESFLLLGTQFAAGIFLGTSLLHFLSDSTSTFESLTSIDYPFSFMLACAGYMLTMLGDCIVLHVANKITKGNNKASRVEDGLAEQKDEGYRNDHQGQRQLERVTEVDGGVMHHNLPMFTKTTTIGDTFLLIIALCFHSIFEGIAVGVADTEADAWRNLWTITLHKVFAAIAMGIALLKMIPKRPFLATVVYSFAFAISSPIGVGIGIATSQGPAANWIYAIAMGFACGIFIYVAINHLIAKGYKPQSPCYFDTPFYKFFAVLLGVAVMAVVMIWD